MISLDAFVNEWRGESLDTDGFPPDQPYQCYDAFIQYNREVIGCQPTIICAWSGYVKDFWEHFGETILPQYYTQIGPLEKGQPGDVCIWGNAPATPLSHIAVLLADNGSTQHIFGQNQPNPYCTIIDFTSNGLLGYLRPKGANMATITTEAVVALSIATTGKQPSDAIQTKYINQPATQENLDGLITYWAGQSTIPALQHQITDLQAELLKKPEPVATSTPPVNEQAVVQNWLVRLWNNSFKK